MSKKVSRLYEQFQPENYKLDLTIDPEKMTFSGTVAISGKKVGRPSQRITLHQKDLKISNTHVIKHEKQDEKEIPVTRTNTHKAYDEVRIHTDEILYPGEYRISMDFTGKITKSMVGLYPSYFKHDGKEKIIFATQFESHHAREVFPCIDEPEAKATFDLTLLTPDDGEVLSNTLPKQQEKTRGQLKTVFEQTPIMSTYLLAFVYGDIHRVEATTKSEVKIRSWASVAQPKENLQFSVDEAAKVLDFFEDYFETPFPLKKLDQVALPDFDSGAMENWGLVTYREIALLTDPKNRSVPSEQYVALVIAHELSHQWFGNLVTMRWWDDLWLNESFASLAEHICLDTLHPDWHQWEHYTSSDIIACSNRDIYSNVQPVGVEVTHPDEIITLFDPAIVYAKGGRLLKMMREYIGDDAFRAALKEYFTQHAYKNTYRDDLWDSVSKASGKDIKRLMTPWLEQSGMPVITIGAAEKSGQRAITQNRFLVNEKPDGRIWPIPLLASEPTHPEIIDQASSTISYDSKNTPFFNQHGSGHFVTHYSDKRDLENIISDVKAGTVSAEARITFLNDLMLLARSGDTSLVNCLQVVSELTNEPRDAVWLLMGRAIGLASNLGEFNGVVEDGLKKMRSDVAHKNYENLGWDDNLESDDLNTISLRSSVLGFMLGSEHKPTITEALKRYESYKDLSDIPADRRGHILATAVRHDARDEIIDRLIDYYQNTQDPDMQMSIANALGSTRSKDVARRLCNDAMNKNGFVRDQDLFRWFGNLMRNKYTRDVAWDWLVAEWPRITEDNAGGKSLEYYIWIASSPLQTKEWQAKFTEFFEPMKSEVLLKRNIAIAESEIRARVAWRDRDLPKLEAYFKSLQ